MPKLDLLDLETFINLPTSLLSPLEVPRQIESNTLLSQSATTLPNTARQETASVMRQSQAESSGVFYRPKAPKLKLEMEIFGDLSVYCQSTKMMAASKAFQNAVDELNTPVFEKAPFDYDRPSHSTGLLDVITSTEDPFNFKIKTELPSIDTVNNIEDNLTIEDGNIAFMEGESKDISNMMMPSDINTSMGRTINNYVVISSQGISTNSSNVFTTPNNSAYEDILYHNTSDKVTPIYKELVNEEDEYLPTVNNCSDIYFNNNSNGYCVVENSNENSNNHASDSPHHQYIVLQTAPFETPDNSRSASEFSDNGSPSLTLNIDQKCKNVGELLDTPDVIETIDAIESEKGFNILNFITEEDINTAEPALSTLDIPIITSTIISNEEPQSPIKKAPISTTKYTLKRKHRKDDDDEDYIPPVPIKKRVVGRKTLKIPQKPVLYDSDSSAEEEEEIVKPTRRGRPPKRTVSICSEDYGDGTGKYREMRDKNNEASRKSRLKRKMKEIAHEEEANDLEDRNTKLKAQVAELERTVNNFRNNLMQILLNK